MKIKKYLFLISLIALFLFAWLIWQNYTTYIEEPNIMQELKEKADTNYLNRKVKEALDSKSYEDAKIYIDIAQLLHIPIRQNLLLSYNKQQSFFAKTKRDINSFYEGFFISKSSNGASLSGNIISDFTFIGDLRDIYKEGGDYISGKSYDKFTLSIALVGLALTASSYMSLGITSPLKATSSILKIAHKSKKITKSFTKVISKKLSNSINFNSLKEINFKSFSKMKASLKKIKDTIHIKPLKQLLNQLNILRRNTSTIDTIKLLKYINSEKDLERVVKLSKKYHKNTIGVLKILGKSALRAGKLVIKYTIEFISIFIGFFISFIGFIFTFKSLIYMKR